MVYEWPGVFNNLDRYFERDKYKCHLLSDTIDGIYIRLAFFKQCGLPILHDQYSFREIGVHSAYKSYYMYLCTVSSCISGIFPQRVQLRFPFFTEFCMWEKCHSNGFILLPFPYNPLVYTCILLFIIMWFHILLIMSLFVL